jgi:hypothetical protein
MYLCCEANDSGVSTPAILLEVVGSSANCGNPSCRFIKFVGLRGFLAVSIRNAFKYTSAHVSTKKEIVTLIEKVDPSFKDCNSYLGRCPVRISARASIILIGFSQFCSVPPGQFQDGNLNLSMTASFHNFEIYCLPLLHNLAICAPYSDLPIVSLHKLA